MQVHVQRPSWTKWVLKESTEYNLIKCMLMVHVLHKMNVFICDA